MCQEYKYKETNKLGSGPTFVAIAGQSGLLPYRDKSNTEHAYREAVAPAKGKGNFMTVHLEDEAFGEVYLDFYLRFQAELGPVWTLCDSNGKSHQVAFNKDPTSPRLTHGWMNLRRFYQFTGDCVIYLSYLGDNVFRFDIFREEALPHHFPSYHSKTMKGRPIYFEVTLSHEAATGTQLSLKNDFAKFVKKLGYRTLFLRGPFITISCSVLIGKDGHDIVKLGNGWRNFFELNRFRKGHKLKFQFMNVVLNNAAVVTRI